jgi:hypothetical protein
VANDNKITKTGDAEVKVDGETVEIAAGAVESVTTEVPHEADADSAPGPYKDLDVNRPPVSTNDPQVPIAHSLIAGAGAPTGEPEIHPETHVADNAYVSDADHKAGLVQESPLDEGKKKADKAESAPAAKKD